MTLKNRVAILERANTDTEEGGYLDLPPVMAYDEWCEAAAKQQAALIKDTYENA